MQAKLISGPTGIHIGIYRGVAYYLIEDSHYSLTDDCVEKPDYTIITWLEYMAGLDIMTDIYLELPIKGTFSVPLGYLDLTVNHFNNCVRQIECPYTNSRFHYLDIRQSNIAEVSFYNLMRRVLRDHNLIVLKAAKNKEFLTTTISFEWNYIFLTVLPQIYLPLLKLIFGSDNLIRDIDRLLSKFALSPTMKLNLLSTIANPMVVFKDKDKVQHKIRKQLLALNEPKLAKLITTYCINLTQRDFKFEEVRVAWNILKHQYELARIGEYDQVYKFQPIVEKGINQLTVLGAIIMDAYTLGRIFRDFTPKSEIRIIYAGSGHINRYLYFFNRLLGVVFYHSTPISFRCQKLLM